MSAIFVNAAFAFLPASSVSCIFRRSRPMSSAVPLTPAPVLSRYWASMSMTTVSAMSLSPCFYLMTVAGLMMSITTASLSTQATSTWSPA